jgi:protein tyrosine phosphatase (PTP) superfamily phosphohydrolase (DUF442 family)
MARLYPLSLRERVGVRVNERRRRFPLTPALSRRERGKLHLPPFVVLTFLILTSCSTRPKELPTTQPLASPQELPGLPDFAQVSPELYRGAQPTPVGFEHLKEMGIRTVVDVRGKSHTDHIESLGLKYIQIPSSVSRPDQQQIIQFLRIVRDPQNQPVFVHDDVGGDRAGLYVAAYRMAEQGWSARDAEAELPRFHFDPYWTQIPTFLDHLDIEAIRTESRRPPTTQTMPAIQTPTTQRSEQKDHR